MDRVRLTLSLLLALAALGLVLPGIDNHGFWFDEAYTARLATLDWPRLLAGAQRDVHPPGWPLLAGVFIRLPVPAEWALRLPSALCFAALVGLVGARSALAGVALLFYTPLVEQATQARPYVPLALGLVALVRLIERQAWAEAGVAIAVVTSLHALGGPLCVAVLVATVPWKRPSRRDLARMFVPPLVVCVWWVPSFATSVARYAQAPWYAASAAADWWIASDAGGAVVAATLVVLAAAVRKELRPLAPALVVGGLLLCLDTAGIGVEVRKTGLVLLPLLLAGLGAGRAASFVALASAGALAATAVRIPDRPDLREAHTAATSLGANLPVVSVFASEASWYFRSPAPLPSFREPQAISARLQEVTLSQDAPCIISIALPGTFPKSTELTQPLRTVLLADVTGLDVRLVGTDDCSVRGPDGTTWQVP